MFPRFPRLPLAEAAAQCASKGLHSPQQRSLLSSFSPFPTSSVAPLIARYFTCSHTKNHMACCLSHSLVLSCWPRFFFYIIIILFFCSSGSGTPRLNILVSSIATLLKCQIDLSLIEECFFFFMFVLIWVVNYKLQSHHSLFKSIGPFKDQVQQLESCITF